ncbi:MAG: hypothetical protein P8N28_02035 [Phycisphaerales bacterium]|nr:hypothetical protein [Phycisphaerales bacterium]
MKKVLEMFVVSSVATTVAMADIYTDPIGDIATGNANLDITSFEITDNGADLFMTIEVADLSDTWGNYMIFLDVPGIENINSDYSGSGDNDNPWGRNVSGLAGTDFFFGGGSWGHETYAYLGSGWDSFGGISYSFDGLANTMTFVFNNVVADLSLLGIEGVNFEVGSTGGNWGDPAIDLLNGTGGSWGGSSEGAWEYYQFSTVPAPSALALLAVAGLVRRRRH